MSEFPGSPKLLKGALVVFETPAPVPTSVIGFQYNPEKVSRSFQQQSAGGDRGRSAGDTQYACAPTETFTLKVELDATDGLETGDPLAVGTGVHPRLAALELLAYPRATDLIVNKALAFAGAAMIRPASVPLVLLVWGPMRVLPVRVESVAIAEEAFDQLLNPTLASVDLTLRTLSERELHEAGPAFEALSLVNLVAKEALARTSAVTSIVEIGGSVGI